MHEWRTSGSFETLRRILASALAATGLLTIVGGLACKSSRWTGIVDGTGAGWIDGVKPWAILAVFGGMAILVLLGFGTWTEHWTIPALASAILMLLIAQRADAYLDGLEIGFLRQTYYTEQHIALGLKLVPVAATFGAFSAGLLAIVSIRMHLIASKCAEPFLPSRG